MMHEVITQGLPTGIQNSVISIGNIVIQKNINSFGSFAMAGVGAYSKKTGKKCLWVTANNFGDKKFMAGAATSCCADVFAAAAAKVRACLDAAVKLGATG